MTMTEYTIRQAQIEQAATGYILTSTIARLQELGVDVSTIERTEETA